MNKVDTSKLQNAEHLAFMTDLLSLLKKSKLEPLNELITKFDKVVQDEELSQKEIKKSEYTAKLTLLDKQRGDIYRGLVFRLKSELLSMKTEAKNAAKKLMLVVDTYGNFINHNYQKETTEIQNFIVELKSEEYASSVELLEVSEWITWLETLNNDFLKAYTARRDEYASRPDLNTKKIRKEGDVLFKELQRITDALEILQPSEELNTLLSKANASIDKWNDVLSLRYAKTNKKEMTEEDNF